MRMRSRWQVIAALAMCGMLAAGCARKSYSVYSDSPGSHIAASARSGYGRESLFPSDQAVIGNDEIDLILGSEVRLPSQGRLAILRMTQPS